MQLRKTKEKYGKMPQADLDGDGDGDGIHATIYVLEHDAAKQTATIAYAPDAPLRPDGLDFAHEAAHVLRNLNNDEMHHPWWHFCGLVGHTLRSRRHLTQREINAGRALARAPDNAWIRV